MTLGRQAKKAKVFFRVQISFPSSMMVPVVAPLHQQQWADGGATTS